jgi:hypothetical protein
MARSKKAVMFEFDPELNETLTKFARERGLTRLFVVERGIEAFMDLMDRHERTAEKATDDDIKELFLRLASEMPVGVDGAKVEEARFPDGRPALVFDGEWVIAPDRNDELMVARKNGGALGRIHRGRPEILRDPELEAQIAAIN